MYRQQQVNTKTPEKALATLEWLCAKMERCTSDARRSLWRWGLTDSVTQDSIIEKLVKQGFIDDKRYASAFVRDKLLTGRWGASKIRIALITKGITKEIVDDVMAENVEPQKMREKLEQNIAKQIDKERLTAKNNYDLRQRLFRRSASRGYDFEDINSILNKLLDE